MKAYSLPAAEHQAVIDGLRKAVAQDDQLRQTPDDLLLAALHALTGRTGDLIRHVSATANRYRPY
jgi:hypothetical protein